MLAPNIAATSVLTGRSFRVTWNDEWSGIAERGSKVGNALAGALAQYYKIGLFVMTADAGQSVIRVQQLSSGAMGGLIGMARTKKAFAALRSEVAKALTEAGILVSTTDDE